jgi:2-amino-4-hydroxy-6-hydroxymethyldihydropteridine diphosphokinase
VDRVAVALGSNVGDRRAHLNFAADRLRTLLDNLKISASYETEPVGVAGAQPLFLNAAAVGETAMSAHALLDALLAIERERGRERPYPNAPRTLDLDLILFGNEVIEEPDLVVPHPRFRQRAFVLEPLASIAPDLVDPVTRLTVADLAQRIRG